MWDVNSGYWVSDVFDIGEFDLNYVGCEQREVLHGRARAVGFDLNYVGCERI